MWKDNLLTEEQRIISAINYEKACKYFGIKKGSSYVLHHIDPTIRHTDIERYIQWNPEDLIPMTRSEHTKLHNELRQTWVGENNPWYGKDRSGENNPMYGKKRDCPWTAERNKHNIGELNPFYGKQHTDETKDKISKANTGKKRTEEQKLAQSERQKGSHRSEETKLKMSLARKAYWAKKKGGIDAV